MNRHVISDKIPQLRFTSTWDKNILQNINQDKHIQICRNVGHKQ